MTTRLLGGIATRLDCEWLTTRLGAAELLVRPICGGGRPVNGARAHVAGLCSAGANEHLARRALRLRPLRRGKRGGTLRSERVLNRPCNRCSPLPGHG